MTLDLAKTVDGIERLASDTLSLRDDRSLRMREAAERMAAAPPESVRLGQSNAPGQRPFLWAKVGGEGLGTRHDAKPPPESFTVASVDGSHVDVDRHLPMACALVNIGGCVLSYGAEPFAHLFNRPTLLSHDQLYLTEQTSRTVEVAVEGGILGLRRAVEEVQALSPLIQDHAPAHLPTLALVDGSLILWGVTGAGYPGLVKKRIIHEGLVPALDTLRRQSQERNLALAAYVSLPRSREAANALRLYVCEQTAQECERVCTGRRSPYPPCSLVNHLLDRELFETLLEPGQRSALFESSSLIVEEYGPDHRIFFYYVNTGEEIGRVEMPAWTALEPGLLDLTHSLIVDQCRKGMGYPTAISEAHEQAVINNADRRRFHEMLARSLSARGLPVYTSQKSRSKRMAWL